MNEVVTKSTKRELYKVDSYSVKMEAMIAKIRTKKPGTIAKEVGKNEILALYKKEIQALIDDGYTVKDIATIMKSDVFGVLPKTITQMLHPKAKRATKSATVKATKAATVDKQSTKQITKQLAEQKQEPSGTFPVNPDIEKL